METFKAMLRCARHRRVYRPPPSPVLRVPIAPVSASRSDANPDAVAHARARGVLGLGRFRAPMASGRGVGVVWSLTFLFGQFRVQLPRKWTQVVRAPSRDTSRRRRTAPHACFHGAPVPRARSRPEHAKRATAPTRLGRMTPRALGSAWAPRSAVRQGTKERLGASKCRTSGHKGAPRRLEVPYVRVQKGAQAPPVTLCEGLFGAPRRLEVPYVRVQRGA